MTVKTPGRDDMAFVDRFYSPVHDAQVALGVHWAPLGEGHIALRVGSLEDDRTASGDLSLCDVSILPKLGLKGGSADQWLLDRGVETPIAKFSTSALDDGGFCVNLPGYEYFLESGLAGSVVMSLSEDLPMTQNGVYRVERQDAAFVLSGKRAGKVLTQVCALDFAELTSGDVVLTGVAGVSCMILRQGESSCPHACFRLWCDSSWACYLWGILVQVTADLDGCVVGAAAHYPQLAEKMIDDS